MPFPLSITSSVNISLGSLERAESALADYLSFLNAADIKASGGKITFRFSMFRTINNFHPLLLISSAQLILRPLSTGGVAIGYRLKLTMFNVFAFIAFLMGGFVFLFSPEISAPFYAKILLVVAGYFLSLAAGYLHTKFTFPRVIARALSRL